MDSVTILPTHFIPCMALLIVALQQQLKKLETCWMETMILHPILANIRSESDVCNIYRDSTVLATIGHFEQYHNGKYPY